MLHRLLILLAALTLLPAATASARTRTLHGSGGFTAHAPKGYALKGAKGLYKISGHGGTLRYARVAAAGRTPAKAGTELARALKAKPKHVAKSSNRWRATVGKRSLDIRRKPGKQLAVRTFSGANRAALRRIGNTIRGGKAAALPKSIAMRKFTAPDGGSSALVPELKGWSYTGGGGIIEGAGPQGAFVFGYPFAAAVPGTYAASYQRLVAAYPSSAADGLSRVLPAELRRLNLALSNVSALNPFPGAGEILSSPFTGTFASANFAGTGGRPGKGVFLYGYAPPDENGTYLNYTSFVVVTKGTDPRVAAALLRAWGSWDPSADQQRRIASTTNTILTTQVAGGGIDPKVFDEAAAKWDAYIRGPQKDDDNK